MGDDVREKFSPSEETTNFFWTAISEAHADQGRFKRMTDDELIEFSTIMKSLQALMQLPPFLPESPRTEDSISIAASWTVSQGKEFFMRVWDQPKLFHEVYLKDEYHEGYDFEFSADAEWMDRHDTDIPLL